MTEAFITLKCESCGGKLDVYEDMGRFACGYCGTELIVQRRGGTVALKLVEAAIQKVQVGTDKTAAELALVRLNEELKSLTAKAAYLKGGLKFKIPSLAFSGLCFMFGGGVVYSNWSSASGDGVMFGIASIVCGIYLLRNGLDSSSTQLDEIETEIEELRRRIAVQKTIVDS